MGRRGKEDKLSVVMELGRRKSYPDTKMAAIVAWHEARSDVQTWQIGQEFNLGHGDYRDIEEEQLDRPISD